MRDNLVLLCLSLVIPLLLFARAGADEPGTSGETVKMPILTAAGQKEFLERRTHGYMPGTFDSVCSTLYALSNVAIHTGSPEVNRTRLASPFPRAYSPRWSEVFDDIARQTGSAWKYDTSTGYWVFSPAARALPYVVTLAPGWKAKEEGLFVKYVPPSAPVGMDIYMLGTYSADDGDGKDLFAKVRDNIALSAALPFKKDVSLADMKKTKVDGVEALYFEHAAPRPHTTWRQWVFVKDGRAFMIVSSLDDNAGQLKADVKAMVESFHVK